MKTLTTVIVVGLCLMMGAQRSARQESARPAMHDATAATYEHLATAIIEIRATEDALVKGILLHSFTAANNHLQAAMRGRNQASHLEPLQQRAMGRGLALVVIHAHWRGGGGSDIGCRDDRREGQQEDRSECCGSCVGHRRSLLFCTGHHRSRLPRPFIRVCVFSHQNPHRVPRRRARL